MDIFSANYERLIKVLKEHHYEEIRILPLVRKKVPWLFDEILFLINYQFIKKHSYFTPTFFTAFYHHHFKSQKPYTFTLFKLFAQNKPVSSQELKMFLSNDDIDSFVQEKFLEEDNGYFRSRVRILPFFDYFIITDCFDRTIKDFTYFGIDSIQLANDVRSTLAGRKFQRALDIGTGTGIQALNIACLCEEILGIDINPRAINFAQTNARINNVPHVKFCLSNLFEKVSGKFNLVVSNPPFVFYPETFNVKFFRDGDGGKLGLELTTAILDELDNILTDDGIAKVICTSPVIKGNDMIVKEIERIFLNKNYRISLKPVRYFMHPKYFFFHRRHHITYNTLYVITLEKGCPYSLNREDKNLIVKLLDFIEIGLLYIYLYGKRILGLVSD